MSRTRVEIQKDVNTWRTDVKSMDITLSDPMWDDDKSHPEYIKNQQWRAEKASELEGFEQELEQAKARGEKGRTPDEIRNEISETQSKLAEQNSMVDRFERYSMQWIMYRSLARTSQCSVNVLQLELQEAIEEESKIEIDAINKMFEQEIQLNPNNAEVYKKRGFQFLTGYITHGGNQVFSNYAIADFSKAIKLAPNDADAYCSRAELYTQMGDHNNAIADYSQAIRINPNNAESYAFRGSNYSQEEKYDQALPDFNKAIQLNPKCTNAYMFRGLLYFGKGVQDKENGDYDSAVANIDKAAADIEETLRLDPKNEAIYNLSKNIKDEKEVIIRMRREEQERIEQERQKREAQEKAKKRNVILLVACLAIAAVGVIFFIITQKKSEKYIDSSGTPAQESSSNTQQSQNNTPALYKVVTNDGTNLRLRDAPGFNSSRIGSLEYGSTVRVLEIGESTTDSDGYRGNWTYVSTSNGDTGWCFGAYLQPIE